jgi:uncharacterized protein HemY
MKDCEAALKVNGDFSEALAERGQVHLARHEYTQAAEDLRRSLTLKIDDRTAGEVRSALARIPAAAASGRETRPPQ